MKYLFLVLFLMAATIIDSHAQSTCSAKTQAGTQCSRKVEKAGEKCWQHGGQTKAQKSGSTTTQASAGSSSATCGAATKAGGKCKNRVKPGARCHLHK